MGLLAVGFIAGTTRAADLVWAKRFGAQNDDWGVSLALDNAGNVYTTGSFGSTVDFDPGPGTYELSVGGPGSHAAFVSKLDAAGNFAWAVMFGGVPAAAQGHAVSVDGGGNVYTVGQFTGAVDFDPGPGVHILTTAEFATDAFVSKLDSSGNLLWAFRMAAVSLFDVDASSPGLIVVGGRVNANAFSVGYGAAWVFSSGGTYAWSAQVATPASAGSEVRGVAADPLGNVHAVGRFSGTSDFDPGPGVYPLSSAQGSYDLFVSKLDNTGALAWARHVGGVMDDSGAAIALDGSGNVHCTGEFNATADFDPGTGIHELVAGEGNSDAFVLKLDSDGDFAWAGNLGGGFSAAGTSIGVDPAGNVYTTGYFYGPADFDPGPGSYVLPGEIATGVRFVFLSRLDVDGGFVWAGQLGRLAGPLNEAIFDVGESLAVDAVGGLYAVGEFSEVIDLDPGTPENRFGSSGSADVFVVKLSQLPVLQFYDLENLAWAPVPGGTTYNIYRSGGVLPGTFYCLASGEPSPSYIDTESPDSDAVFAYLVTAVNGSGQEGSLGYEAVRGIPTAERPNPNPCP